jgi:2-polyprenyl-3-methyl-5-hydroxy-6-metoxy-1,4-benzoquinol methylase
MKSTETQAYKDRLFRLQKKSWKKRLKIQEFYAHQVIRLQPGRVLEIGCGIGRLLEHLPDAVGIDHNLHSVNFARELGFQAFTEIEFKNSKFNIDESFDSILLAHVVEHLTFQESVDLISNYLPLLKVHGKLIIICPQQSGYRSDKTHITFTSFSEIRQICKTLNFHVQSEKSFPFPRFMGNFFRFNEFIVMAISNQGSDGVARS